MITKDTVVVGRSIADLTLEQFSSILESGGSPALIDAEKSYQAIVNLGVSPAFCLGIFLQESAFGTAGIATVNKSPGNTRSSQTGVGVMVTTTKGVYIRYPYWWEGWRDLAWRLVKPDYVYAQEGRKTIAQIIERWAPDSDGNDSAKYIATVVSVMNQWIEGGSKMKDPTNTIDIVHPNKGREGASPAVITIHVQEGTNYLPDFFKQSGDDSTMWCKQDGTLIRMEQDSDSAWTNGRMIEPIDHANPVIQGLYNQGVRNSNNYALTIENQGFASQGFTDAQVEANAKMCAYWMLKYGWADVDTRIVGHFQIGEHKLCPGSKYPWARLRARVSELLGGINHVTNEQPSNPVALPYGVTVDPVGALIFPGNIPLNFGFKDAFLTLFGNVDQGDLSGAILRAVKIFGLPVAPEVADNAGSSQDFELCEFRFNKNEAEGWKVRLYRDKAA